MWVAALVAAAASIGSAIIAARAQSASEEQARALLERARNELGELDLPTLEQLAGQELPPTELAKIQTDPKYKQAQLAALDKLQEISDSGGMTMQDTAVLDAAMGKVARQEGAGREAIRQNMASRGVLGSGAELAMSLQNQQDSAQRANTIGLDVAGRAQARAYDAILNRGQLAGQMHQQEYNEKSKAAQAQDLINRYNATRKSNAAQQDFENRFKVTSARNGMTGQIADSARRQGQIASNAAGAAGNAVNQGAMAYATYAGQSPTSPGVKTDDEILKEAELYGYE